MAGLVGPEAANNAASAGAMVPLLTLGIPGSASTAVLLAAFLLWGLRPGPLLMGQNPEFAWGLIASMYLGNVALLLLNIFAIPLFVLMLRVPYRILAPAVIVLCTIGTYSVHGSILETWLMFAAGIVGFFMKLFGFSPAAIGARAGARAARRGGAAPDAHDLARLVRDLPRAPDVGLDRRHHARDHRGRAADAPLPAQGGGVTRSRSCDGSICRGTICMEGVVQGMTLTYQP